MNRTNQMNKSIKLFTFFILISFIIACTKTPSNDYIGKLPDLCKDYENEIINRIDEIKGCSDLYVAIILDNNLKSFKNEADKAVEEYVLQNLKFVELPFEQKAENPYSIRKICIKTSGYSRMYLTVEVFINEDILDETGIYKNNFFAYTQAVDSKKYALVRTSVLANDFGVKGPFKKGMEVKMYGYLDSPSSLQNFSNFVFISKEEYERSK